MGELIDREDVLSMYRVTDPGGTFALCSSILRDVKEIPAVDAIPADYIRARAHEATGPEGTYLRRLIEEWEKE